MRIEKSQVYGIITITSAIFGVLSGSTNFYYNLEKFGDEKQPVPLAVVTPTEDLRSRLTHAINIVKDCRVSDEEKSRIKTVLNTAINELMINNDLEKSNQLFDGVKQDLVSCVPQQSPRPDSDGDDILDSTDSCPYSPETFNGFLDSDGCPDSNISQPDADYDGIPDQSSKPKSYQIDYVFIIPLAIATISGIMWYKKRHK